MAGLAFNKTEFWLPIHNALQLCMNREVRKFLGSLIDKVVDIDTGAIGDCLGRYLRVKVVVDVSKSLKRYLRVDLSDSGEETIMLLHYEKLPEYCFGYGLLGHVVCMCPQSWNIADDCLKRDEFGSWMRATSPTSRNIPSRGKQAEPKSQDNANKNQPEVGSDGSEKSSQQHYVVHSASLIDKIQI
ncbi:hypothetical protein ACOSQ3_031443 [Xanthoceras sorbifolium]